jgi:hypothetical protein
MNIETKTNQMIKEIKKELESVYFHSDLHVLIKGAYEFADYHVFHSLHRDRYEVDEIDSIWRVYFEPYISCVAKLIDKQVSHVHVYGTEGILVSMCGRNVVDPQCVVDEVDWENRKITINYDAVAEYIEYVANSEVSILDCFTQFWRDIRN